MNPSNSYRIFPLGDSALTLDFGNLINEPINQHVIARFQQLRERPIPNMIEAIPAYSSLTIYYNTVAICKTIPKGVTAFDWMKDQLEERMRLAVNDPPMPSAITRIPVCYEHEFAPDIQHLAITKNITPDEVIEIHTSTTYRVYMLGFLPGFAYMGEVNELISMPRKPQPQAVAAGSVGIAGKQTGVYPLSSPGGWQIIGRTPLILFDARREEPALLKAGDTVQFYSIGKNEFANY